MTTRNISIHSLQIAADQLSTSTTPSNSPTPEEQLAASRAQIDAREQEEDGSIIDHAELRGMLDEDLDPFSQEEGKQQQDAARQKGIWNAEILSALLLYYGTPMKAAEDDFTNYCARIAATDHVIASDVHVFREKVKSVIPSAESVITEGVDPSSLNMRLFLVLRTVAQCTKPGERETEYASDARSEEAQLNSKLHDNIARNSFASGDVDSYQIAYLIDKYHLRGGVEGLHRLAAMSDTETLHFLCSAREALAGHLVMDVIPKMMDGEMLRCGNALAFELFGNDNCTFGSSSIAPHYFNPCANHSSLRRTLYSMCALIGAARQGMLKEHLADAQKAGVDETLACARLASNPEWMEVESLVQALSGVYRHRRDNRSLTTDTNASIAALCSAFADWFDGCTHNDTRFHALQFALSASCFTIGRVTRKLQTLWTAYTAKAGVRTLCLWGAAEFACSAALSIKGKVIPLHAACLLVLSGAIGACCHEEIDGPFVFSPSPSAMMRRVLREIGKLSVPDARADDRVPRFSDSTCGYALTLRDMIDKDKVRIQNSKDNYAECLLRASLVHLAYTEGLRDVVVSSDVSCLPSQRNKQGKRLELRAKMAHPACAGSDCFRRPGKHFLDMTGNSEHAYKNNDILGGAVVTTILYPIASKALKDTVVKKFGHLKGLSPEEQKRFSISTTECLEEFLSQLDSLVDDVFNKYTRLTRQGPRGERIKNLPWAELVFAQQIHFISYFIKAVRGSSTVFSRICNATSRHVKRSSDICSDEDDLWEDCPQTQDCREDDEWNAAVGSHFPRA